MTREEFIKGSINSTNNSMSQAKAQLVVDGSKPRTSKNLLQFIEQCQVKLIRYDMGTLNEGEIFHLEIINK